MNSGHLNGQIAGHDLLLKLEELIGTDLLLVEQIFAEELDHWHPFVLDVLEHLTRYRGKRLRPMLLLISALAVGEIKQDHRILAAVVEMIHTATLVHDDVLDDAETRRHVATINSRWNTETSVLLGDYLFTHSFHLAAQLESTLACRLIGKATNKVCVGELSQIHERGNLELTEEVYLKILDGKTAELCALSCYLGAHFAGADEETSRDLEEYGRSLGIAFQIADDLLDLLGDENQTGKSLGSDLTKQKLTLPLIHLIERASETEKQEIQKLLDNPAPETWAQLQPYIQRYEALEYTRKRAQDFINQACDSLSKLPNSTAKRMLEEITEFVISRSF